MSTFNEADHPRAGDGTFTDKTHTEGSVDLRDWGTVHVGERTPWGSPNTVTETAPGVMFASCPGHGGYKLSRERNKTIPAPLRNSSGWYEEDCEAYIVTWLHPDAASENWKYMAGLDSVAEESEEYVKNWFPDGWEKATGRTLERGDSRVKDEADWTATHQDVTTLYQRGGHESDTHAGFVEATVRRPDGQFRTLLIPVDEFTSMDQNREKFGRFTAPPIIDETKYRDITPAPTVIPPRTRYRTVTVDTLTARQQQLADRDLAVRWRMPDGTIRTTRDIIDAGHVHAKRSYFNSETGKTDYSLSWSTEPEGTPPADTSSYRIPVSKALWDAFDAPDTRKPSELAYEKLRRAEIRAQSEWDIDRRIALHRTIDALTAELRRAVDAEKGI